MDGSTSRTADRYSGPAGDAYHGTLHAVSPQAADLLASQRAAKFAPYVSAKDRVVELGVGPGWNLWKLECRDRVGVDLSTAYAADLDRRGICFLTASSSVPDGTADVVLCHHMLEHVTNPADVLVEASRILGASGRLLLYVPYENRRRYRHYDPGEKNMHLYSWNAQTLGALVVSCGFAVEAASVEQFGYDRLAARIVSRVGAGEAAYRAVRCLLRWIRPLREVRVIARRAPDGGATPNT